LILGPGLTLGPFVLFVRAPDQLRQLGDIRRDPPRFIFGEQFGR
jgi:hypothetical protein